MPKVGKVNPNMQERVRRLPRRLPPKTTGAYFAPSSTKNRSLKIGFSALFANNGVMSVVQTQMWTAIITFVTYVVKLKKRLKPAKK